MDWVDFVAGQIIHFWKSGRVGPINFTEDCILGREAAGEIIAVGDGFTDLKVGISIIFFFFFVFSFEWPGLG